LLVVAGNANNEEMCKRSSCLSLEKKFFGLLLDYTYRGYATGGDNAQEFTCSKLKVFAASAWKSFTFVYLHLRLTLSFRLRIDL